MNKVVMMAMFSIIVNLLGGVVTTVIVDTDGNQLFGEDSSGYIFEGENYSSDLITDMEGSIKPSGSIDDKGDQIYRVLDTIQLGFVYKFVSAINDYMFGFIDILDNLMGDYLLPEVRGLLFGDDDPNNLIPNKTGALKIGVIILYTFASIRLFTGKDLVND